MAIYGALGGTKRVGYGQSGLPRQCLHSSALRDTNELLPQMHDDLCAVQEFAFYMISACFIPKTIDATACNTPYYSHAYNPRSPTPTEKRNMILV